MKFFRGLLSVSFAMGVTLAVGIQEKALATDSFDRRVLATDADLPKALLEALQSVVFVDVLLTQSAISDATVRDGGTGILVAPCLILTAAHLLGKVEADESRVREISVLFPLVQDEEAGPVKLPAKVEHWPGRTFLPDPLLDDWVLLRLDTPAPVAVLPMASPDCCNWYKIPIGAATGGFPADKLDRSAIEMWVDPACTIRLKLANSMMATNCQATSGNSGGPLLVSEAGRWKLAGMITRAPPPAPDRHISDTTSYAISMRRYIRTVIAEAEAAHCPPQRENIEGHLR